MGWRLVVVSVMARAILAVVPSVAQAVVKVGLLNSYTGFIAQTAPGDLLTLCDRFSASAVWHNLAHS